MFLGRLTCNVEEERWSGLKDFQAVHLIFWRLLQGWFGFFGIRMAFNLSREALLRVCIECKFKFRGIQNPVVMRWSGTGKKILLLHEYFILDEKSSEGSYEKS